MNATNPRTLRVFIAGWVIQDGSFPRASIGDAADVVLEHCSSADAPSICDETRTATARPAYGRGPTRHRDGQWRWLHLLYGDGWSSKWWTDEPTHGPVTLTGIFSAGSGELNGIDTPPRVCGRITRMHLVHKQVEPMDNGWTGVAGTDRLTEIETVPAAGRWWPTEKTKDGDFVESGVLLELDLDNVPTKPTPFAAGAVTLDGNTVWVMHQSDPILLRVRTAGATPIITRYVLPLTIEPPVDRWARRIHTDDGIWITSEHDTHYCTIDPDGALSVDRIITEGGWASAVHDGQLYYLGSTRSAMSSDRRYGIIRTYPDMQRVRLVDRRARRIVPVDEPEGIAGSRADRATGPDGTQWCVDGTETLRRIDPDGTTSSIDLPGEAVTGTVEWTTPDAFEDPANEDVVSSITVDDSRFIRKTE
ncbi:hypothetical protein E5720_05045 [Rhodococcus sp. PAMC28707]|uniref:hypothetical protein n=1 Tax=unclassified Rhodococcus (in: high G+C Gram-positive bacteria) TaxID=192944 RepID=UPI00109E018A|nr:MULTISPECIES: hypothetical protein [unclassified Rhodococcus (in: high G+C Gram-positive bacteria)]QCB50349.1 hypothetical protein E5769_08970 [Rhodococcus sp. PAMC28705]QCB57959.1 hypothetical protein E5720_05045 [Rhodococcus sp. PAMC28707]